MRFDLMLDPIWLLNMLGIITVCGVAVTLWSYVMARMITRAVLRSLREDCN